MNVFINLILIIWFRTDLLGFEICSEMENHLYECKPCNKVYDKADSYRCHMRIIHGKNSAEFNVSCVHEGCTVKFYNVTEYRKHLGMAHQISMEIERQEFATEIQFLEWKKNFEQATNERFVKNTGVKKSSEGKFQIFECHRSGYETRQPFSVKDRNDFIQGSCKLNSRCPAQMTLKSQKDSYQLTFHKTHTHTIDIRYVNLSDKTCETIAAMMKIGYSHDWILKHYKKQPEDHRDHHVEESDLKNISTKFGLKDFWRAHSEDAKSVHLFVEQNPDKVIFYQHEVKEGDQVVQEFVLVFQTQRQVDFIKKQGKLRVICADSTHNIAGKKKMATIMTVNDDEEGVSLAFCFCNSESTEAMQVFFAAVRKNLGFPIETDIFLSDDANAFYNAWCAEMVTDKPPQKRLCA